MGNSLLTSDAIYIQTGISFGIFFVYDDGFNGEAAPITWQTLGNPNPQNNTVIPSGSIILIKSLTNKSYTIGKGAIIELQNELPTEYFGLNYSIKLQHQPINTIGSSYPKTIKFHGAIEELELTENLYKRILYTGDTKSITINSSAICCPDIDYSISINDAQSISASASTQNNGVVTTLRKFTKYY